MQIPFSPPDITDVEIQEVVAAMKSGWITTGPKTKLFEERIAQYCHTPRAVCMNSATASLEMALRVLGVGPGDEVITSAYTYTASASVIDHIGAKIVLSDVAPGSFHMDGERLAGAITERTKVVMPVDIGGVPCDYDRIFSAVESRKHLFKPGDNEFQRLFNRPVVLADAAHSFGARYRGMISGQVADITCFSFHAVKNLTTAEGGAITWRAPEGLDSDALYNRLMLYSLHGQSKDALAKTLPGAWEYDIVLPGWKCNMTDITAAIGLVQLSRFDDLMKRRKEIIRMYDEALLPLGIERLNHSGEDYEGNGHLYLMRIPGISLNRRNEVITKMAERGVATNVHFKPLPLHSAYKKLGFNILDYPNAYRQYANEITLPLHTLLEDGQIRYIADALKAVLEDGEIKRLPDAPYERVWEKLSG
jgi:dTDP-4-amino-4,6-dideoxygalactose transaminase